jgi:K+/H+ antiporter YhaU regulatory subunit KhtT
VPPRPTHHAACPHHGAPTRYRAANVVRDADGQALAYLYSRENEAEARQAKTLTADEARRIALAIARLPELLGKAESD